MNYDTIYRCFFLYEFFKEVKYCLCIISISKIKLVYLFTIQRKLTTCTEYPRLCCGEEGAGRRKERLLVSNPKRDE